MPGRHADFGVGCIECAQARLMGAKHKFDHPGRDIVREGGGIAHMKQPSIAVFDGHPAMAG